MKEKGDLKTILIRPVIPRYLMAFVFDIKLVKSFDWNEKNHYISFLASCTKTQIRFI